MSVHQSVLELIGRTPIVRAQRLDAGVCELYLKLESHNPGGSIKDRIGLSMIESAEKAGRSSPATRWWKARPATPASAWRWWRSRRATS
ncbi:MAG: pyridoxal-phosphate dependent enzyme [Chiayiivirga sp.]|jgi:cystathionine beta-synthase|nr:pyridoxal-phosphate dependent enzyme [Chiayiivirga sp.]